MSDVACVCSAPIVAEARLRGLDPESLVEGLGIGLAAFENPGGRVPWRAFVEFAGRATKMLSAEAIEELAAEATVASVPGPIKRILPRLSDSRPLFTMAPRWWGPWVFHGTRGTCERLPDGRLREIVQILPEYAACPEFLAGLCGTLRAMPRLLNQPDALVTLEQDGREGVYLITPPPRRTRVRPRLFGGWLRRGPGHQTTREQVTPERELEELGFAREQLLETRRELRSTSVQLEQQGRRLAALEQLGGTLARADEREFPELLQDVAILLRSELDAIGVRLSRRGPISDAGGIAEAGLVSGEADRELPLSVAGREVGRLELWGAGSEAVLPALRPWLGFALEYGGSRALASHLTELLSRDVRDWERMEQRLDHFLAKRRAADFANASQSGGLLIDREAVDLDRFMRDLAPRLRDVAGEDVSLELDCAQGLWPAVFDVRRLEAFLEDVLEILSDANCWQISIETRLLAELEGAGRAATTAEMRIRGEGPGIDPLSRGRLRTAVELCDRGMLVAEIEGRDEDASEVNLRVCLPLVAPGSGGLPN